ncbi:hypothetical protein AVEN_148274-1 [Araneus ventricosus]|uniref:Uncharacterized protein n=1 Tax=Araneus ventricosus TaxID=182803 RepID=A0A4Y2HKC5_ARAVE|nr:hypothetical protein AVEN_148274-1 [Araneus ventricosus]
MTQIKDKKISDFGNWRPDLAPNVSLGSEVSRVGGDSYGETARNFDPASLQTIKGGQLLWSSVFKLTERFNTAKSTPSRRTWLCETEAEVYSIFLPRLKSCMIVSSHTKPIIDDPGILAFGRQQYWV